MNLENSYEIPREISQYIEPARRGLSLKRPLRNALSAMGFLFISGAISAGCIPNTPPPPETPIVSTPAEKKPSPTPQVKLPSLTPTPTEKDTQCVVIKDTTSVDAIFPDTDGKEVEIKRNGEKRVEVYGNKEVNTSYLVLSRDDELCLTEHPYLSKFAFRNVRIYWKDYQAFLQQNPDECDLASAPGPLKEVMKNDAPVKDSGNGILIPESLENKTMPIPEKLKGWLVRAITIFRHGKSEPTSYDPNNINGVAVDSGDRICKKLEFPWLVKK